MIEAIALAIVAVIVTTMLAVAPLLAANELGGWAPFCAAVPFFVLALAQATAVGRGMWRRPENVLGLGVLFAVAPFAAFLVEPIRSLDSDAVLGIIAALLSALIFFGVLAGGLLKVAEPLGTVLGWGMTIVAFVLSAIIPSVPMSLAIWHRHPPASYVHALPSAGELVIEGPPLTIHGVTYQMRKPTYPAGLCMIETSGPMVASGMTFGHVCTVRAIRCDDLRRWCMIDDRQNTEGYTYAGELVTLYEYGFESEDRRGNVAVRVFAELLALAAAMNLWRARGSRDRLILSASALVAATVGVALGIRMMS